MPGIELRSEAFNDHDFIPRHYSKDGEDISPPLRWAGVPDGARELVLLCQDEDAPGGTFNHWVVTGIDPTSGGVDEGVLPDGGDTGRNSFGEPGWGGPLPPVGDDPHRYFFRLYAVDEPVPIPDGVSPDTFRERVASHELASGTLIGLYQR